MGGSFEYEMEMPPNCVFSVNNGEPVTMITNPLISQRRKDAPISIKARLNQKTPMQEISLAISPFKALGKPSEPCEFAVGVYVT